MQDLEDGGWTELKIVSRHVTKEGLRFELETDVQTGKVQLLYSSKPLTNAQKSMLLDAIHEDMLLVDAGHESRLLTHINDMCPEDFEWVQETD